MLKKQCEDVEWIHLPDYRDQWQALVNIAMNNGELAE
jgi:hypothetical protein